MSTPDVIHSATKSMETELSTGHRTTGNVTPQSTLPSWLNKEYLQSALQKYHKDNGLKISSMSSRPALGKGENYGGVLTRIKAEYRTGAGRVQQGYYIAKTSYEDDEFARKCMEPYDIFTREMKIYQEVLPKLKALMKEIGDSEQLFAETMIVDYEHAALIFEDLNVRYFEMPDRIKGLDMSTAKIALRKLAKMHAASAVLNEREKGSLEGFNRGMFNRFTENYKPCFVGLLEACSRMVRQWEDFKEYGKKLEDLKPAYMELAKRVFDPIKDHLNVLAHGDFWTNNILVKYDQKTGTPLDAIIIDFQYSAWGSPGIDLFYFLNSSLQEDIHLHQQDELIQYYYYVLADTLRKLLYSAPIPSLHKFHLQLEEKSFYAFQSSCIVLPVQRLEETDDADFQALMQENERAVNFKNTCYKNPYTQRIIRQLLPVYERRGLLEVDQ